jgi:hypothetical protein
MTWQVYAVGVRSELYTHSPGTTADIPTHTEPHASFRERLLVALVVLFTSLSFFLIQYDRLRTAGPGLETWVQTKLSGSQQAPDQYRIALPLITRFLELHTHLRVNQSLPLIEFLSYAGALTLLYFLFRDSPCVATASSTHRLVLLGFFFAAAQFPVLWIFPWERPETLLTAFFLAAIVQLIVHRSRMPFALVCLLTALLSFGQALVRADVAFIAGIAILLSAAINIPFPRPRIATGILGLLSAAVGGATQFYLQSIAYPHATYPPGTPKIQLFANLNPGNAPLHLPEFLTALLPLIASIVLIRHYRLALDSCDKLVLLLCFLYLPLWVTTGLVVEVRIFVPFLFLASPTIAKLWGTFLLSESVDLPAPAVRLAAVAVRPQVL